MRNVYRISQEPVEVIVSLNAELREYRARLYVEGVAYEPADYFTDDLFDAQATASLMLRHAVAQRDQRKEG